MTICLLLRNYCLSQQSPAEVTNPCFLVELCWFFGESDEIHFRFDGSSWSHQPNFSGCFESIILSLQSDWKTLPIWIVLEHCRNSGLVARKNLKPRIRSVLWRPCGGYRLGLVSR